MKRPTRTSSWHLSGRYGSDGKRAQRYATQRANRKLGTAIVAWLEAIGLLGGDA